MSGGAATEVLADGGRAEVAKLRGASGSGGGHRGSSGWQRDGVA